MDKYVIHGMILNLLIDLLQNNKMSLIYSKLMKVYKFYSLMLINKHIIGTIKIQKL